MIDTLFEIFTGIGPALGAIAAIVLAFFGWGKLQKRAGRKQIKDRMAEETTKALKHKEEVKKNAETKSNDELIAGATRK